MGFGLLFSGYITLLFFKVLPPAMAVGSYLMYRALNKLSVYGKAFRAARAASLALGIYYVLFTAIWIGRMAGLFNSVLSSNTFVVFDDVIYYALLLFLHVTLYAAIEGISKECEYKKGIRSVRFARVLTAMFYVLTAGSIVLDLLSVGTILPLLCFICQIIWYIYTAIIIYGCYMRIATQEIIDDEEKKLAQYNAARKIKK